MSQLDKRRPCPERARITSTALPVECPYSGHSTGNGLRLTIKTGCFIVRICAAAGRPFEVGRRPDRQVVMTRDRRGTLRGPVPTSHYSGPGGLAAGLSSPLARSHNERPLSAANSATLLAMRAAHSMVPAATLRPDE